MQNLLMRFRGLEYSLFLADRVLRFLNTYSSSVTKGVHQKGGIFGPDPPLKFQHLTYEKYLITKQNIIKVKFYSQRTYYIH